ncbi:glycerol-3-phosphate 1-O-acyltransferase PlsY [Leptolyngbya sp. PCC 6406]|uniref:glycerol-3-phosphate 1-O-acyltransferase PlsY n=1 Tax=Leptolyngbya sp. PCC 6406 TaxID=1173264 RepID=UPI0004822696|nr:glycerol-3-phosphate 1-O-acyltransferase PlsY [Leptolyngbya sp. PCC 6406]
MAWVTGLGLLVLAYFLGSIPTGYLVAKAVQGIDIRQYGSGNTGATNVLRVVGKPAAIAVLLVDLTKGLLAVLGMGQLLPMVVTSSTVLNLSPWWITLAGLLAIVGHSKSIWLQWSGGKSAATGLGVLLAMAWPVGLGVALVFATTLAFSRIVSLGSMVAAVAAAVLMAMTQQPLPYTLIAIAGSLYVILRHRTNIDRLLSGTEPRLGSQSSHS